MITVAALWLPALALLLYALDRLEDRMASPPAHARPPGATDPRPARTGRPARHARRRGALAGRA
ncbi:hypothetical protein [Streptomyces sp. NPDC097619]|uniref:hypothetical protein n=1 Tax=Streptomyces sp. NPDC097619 TaxID=3157228 RepID=UPI003321146E